MRPTASAPLVLTVTPNPSIDLLFEAERLVWDDANRTASPRRRLGGQGINVARAVRALGGEAVSLALLAGPAGGEVRSLLEAEGHPLIPVEAEGDTRVFVAARERATGRSLLLNPRGPQSTARSAETLLEATETALRQLAPRWVACGGSVPPGIPSDIYARIGRSVRAAGLRFVPDCDGDILRLALAGGCDLLVPNRHEAERLAGAPIGNIADAAAVARSLHDRGVDLVCVTLGEDGAVLAAADGCWHAATPPEPHGSAVGAGDAFLAAVLLAVDRGAPWPEVVREGVAAGAAALKSEGGDLVTRGEFERQVQRAEVRKLEGDG